MKITNPEMNVIRFGANDVIATSLFYLPVSQYSGSYTPGTDGNDYVEFEGTMRPNGDGTYEITNIYRAQGVPQDDVDGLASGGSVVFYGVTIDMSSMAPIARQTYDAYSYSEGTYYTHGATYYELYWQ